VVQTTYTDPPSMSVYRVGNEITIKVPPSDPFDPFGALYGYFPGLILEPYLSYEGVEWSDQTDNPRIELDLLFLETC